MARNEMKLSETTTIFHGTDDALGYFSDVWDSRAVTDDDEGFVCEWSRLFGYSNNQIQLENDEISDPAFIIQRVNEYFNKLEKIDETVN